VLLFTWGVKGRPFTRMLLAMGVLLVMNPWGEHWAVSNPVGATLGFEPGGVLPLRDAFQFLEVGAYATPLTQK
jgi:hypothetical protein